MTRRFQKGERMIVEGKNGVPDRPGTVVSHVDASVWVEFDDRTQVSTWWWEAHVRPIETAPLQPRPTKRQAKPVLQASLFEGAL